MASRGLDFIDALAIFYIGCAMISHTCVVCTVEILPVWVSHRLRLPSVSPMMTRWPQAAMAVATPSDELDMRPHDGRFGFVSVTCNTGRANHMQR